MMIVRIERRLTAKAYHYVWFVSDFPFSIALARGSSWSRKAARLEAHRKAALLQAERDTEAQDGNS